MLKLLTAVPAQRVDPSGSVQRGLRDLRDALIALPTRSLIAGRFANEDGHVCALGAFMAAKWNAAGAEHGLVLRELARIHPANSAMSVADVAAIAGEFGLVRDVSESLVEFNDHTLFGVTAEQRYEQVLEWVEEQLAGGPAL